VAAAEVEAKAKNKAAYAHLANCLTASRDLGCVCCGKTDAWPNGLAAIVIKCMFRRYKLDDATAMAECQSKLMKLPLGLNDNLSDLFSDIADIKAQYNWLIAQLTSQQLCQQYCVLQQYKSVITAVQVAQGNLMTADDLEDAMDLYHRKIINVAKPTSHNEDGEAALAAFNGACYKCG
jgi:hypothetical protein